MDESREIYYVLDVAHDIRRTDLNVFITQGHTLVKVIENTGELELRMSGWEVDGDVVHIYNYWRLVGGPASLVRAELVLPDNPAFVRFDRFMLSETKELVIPISEKIGLPLDLPVDQPNVETKRTSVAETPRLVYARITYKVRPNKWAELLARLEASDALFARRAGWRLGDTYIGLTGDASTVVQTWAVPEISAPLVKQRLASAPWAPLLDAPPICQILEPIPSCPLLGQARRLTSTIERPALQRAAE